MTIIKCECIDAKVLGKLDDVRKVVVIMKNKLYFIRIFFILTVYLKKGRERYEL